LDLNNKDWSFTNIPLTSNSNFYFNVGDEDRKLVATDLNLTNGNIIINCKGTLTLFVNGTITMKSGSSIKKMEILINCRFILKDLVIIQNLKL
jgi:hypothetical protein